MVNCSNLLNGLPSNMSHSFSVKIVGKAEIPEALDVEKEYVLATRVAPESVTKRQNDDGGYDYTYSLKVNSHVDIEAQGKLIRSKDPKSRSKQMRYAIIRQNTDYEAYMAWYIATKLDDDIVEFQNK